nr:unnamed protein product [uncultured bacterium]
MIKKVKELLDSSYFLNGLKLGKLILENNALKGEQNYYKKNMKKQVLGQADINYLLKVVQRNYGELTDFLKFKSVIIDVLEHIAKEYKEAQERRKYCYSYLYLFYDETRQAEKLKNRAELYAPIIMTDKKHAELKAGYEKEIKNKDYTLSELVIITAQYLYSKYNNTCKDKELIKIFDIYKNADVDNIKDFKGNHKDIYNFINTDMQIILNQNEYFYNAEQKKLINRYETIFSNGYNKTYNKIIDSMQEYKNYVEGRQYISYQIKKELKIRSVSLMDIFEIILIMNDNTELLNNNYSFFYYYYNDLYKYIINYLSQYKGLEHIKDIPAKEHNKHAINGSIIYNNNIADMGTYYYITGRFKRNIITIKETKENKQYIKNGIYTGYKTVNIDYKKNNIEYLINVFGDSLKREFSILHADLMYIYMAHAFFSIMADKLKIKSLNNYLPPVNEKLLYQHNTIAISLLSNLENGAREQEESYKIKFNDVREIKEYFMKTYPFISINKYFPNIDKLQALYNKINKNNLLELDYMQEFYNLV